MKTITKLLLLAALTCAGTASAITTRTVNASHNWLWVTIYDVTRTIHMDYGWVAPCTARNWTGSNGIRGYVRGELKASTDPRNPPGNTPNVADTTIKAKDRDDGFTLFNDPPGSYWSDKVLQRCSSDSTNCCVKREFVTVNATPHWAWITIYDNTKSFHMDSGWVPPCKARAWTGSNGTRNYVRAEVKGSTAPSPPGDTPNIFDTGQLYLKGYNEGATLMANGSTFAWDPKIPAQCGYGDSRDGNCCSTK